MPNAANQKLRLLRLLEIFIKKTDVGDGLTTNQLLDELANYDIVTERKSLYRDFKAMQEFGLEVSQNARHEWYLANRPFTSEELGMLVDAVQSTPFLTDTISKRLISRLKAFASESQERKLNVRIKIPDYVKMQNEGVFENLDAIQDALLLKRKLEFNYFQFNAKKERVLQKDGCLYMVNPLQLVYAEERYYLLTLNERYNNMTPYRVDRMLNVKVSSEKRSSSAASWKLDDNAVLSFGIFETTVTPVTLEIDEGRVSALIDKFGYNIDLRPVKNGKIKAYVRAPLSPQFYGWLLQLGNYIRIVSPKKARNEYRDYLTSALTLYE